MKIATETHDWVLIRFQNGTATYFRTANGTVDRSRDLGEATKTAQYLRRCWPRRDFTPFNVRRLAEETEMAQS